jgi:hypothetical protein
MTFFMLGLLALKRAHPTTQPGTVKMTHPALKEREGRMQNAG